MASVARKTSKSGDYYEIRCHVGRGKPTLTKRWDIPDGWSQRAIDRELAKAAAEFERQCKTGEVVSRAERLAEEARRKQEADSIMTVRRFVEVVYMPSLELRCAENTRLSFWSNLNNHILPAIGEKKLPDITTADLNTLLLDLQKKGLSHSTAMKNYQILNLVFKMAYVNDLTEKNPMDKVAHPKQRKDDIESKSPAAFSVDEMQYIIDCLKAEPLLWKTYVMLLIDTGCRRGEICGLRWADIDFPTNAISINGSLNYSPEKGVYRSSTKSGRSRSMAVSDEVISLLKELRTEQSKDAISKYCFAQHGSPEPMHPTSPTHYFKSFGKRYNIPDFHPHKMRHSFASIALANGADVVSVSERLGHADTAITLRTYSHANQETIDRAGAVFRDALKPKNKQSAEG